MSINGQLFYTKATALNDYLVYLRDFRRMSEGRREKNRKWLNRIEAALGCALVEAKTGSQINRAIEEISNTRRTTNNGGHMDDGTNFRFCLGQAAACYLRWAHSEAVIERNPYPKNPFPETCEYPPNYLSDEEGKLEKIFNSDTPLFIKLAIHILIDTGMRISELCKLKVSDYDANKKIFTVFMTKVSSPKYPVVTEKTVNLLNLWLKTRNKNRSIWIFPGRLMADTPMGDKSMRVFFLRLGKELGFRMNPHSFRHTMATIWLEAGAQETEIMNQMGIKDRRTLRKYTHPSRDHMHKVQKRVYSRVPVLAEK